MESNHSTGYNHDSEPKINKKNVKANV